MDPTSAAATPATSNGEQPTTPNAADLQAQLALFQQQQQQYLQQLVRPLWFSWMRMVGKCRH